MQHTTKSCATALLALQNAITGKEDNDPLVQIVGECLAMALFLRDKNTDYGNSALTEDDIFARGVRPSVAIRIRMADKLKRLRSGSTIIQEDTIRDLAGYIILLRVAEAMEGNANVALQLHALNEAQRTESGIPPRVAQVDTSKIRVVPTTRDIPFRGSCLCGDVGRQRNPECPTHGHPQPSSGYPPQTSMVHPLEETPTCPIHGEGCDCASQ